MLTEAIYNIVYKQYTKTIILGYVIYYFYIKNILLGILTEGTLDI